MAFLNNLKSMPMPPIKNALNVAWQSAKQSLPTSNKQQQQYEDPSSDYGGSSNISHGSSQRPQNVRFADTVDEPAGQRPTELNPLNPFRNPNGYVEEQSTAKGDYQYEETGFNQGEYNYQQGGFPPGR